LQNYEYKAELRDPALARSVCRALGAILAETVEQTDTYYRVPDSRLKKRESPGHATEYILYHRPNMARPRLSNYTIYSQEQALERFGAQAMPVLAVVKKRREIWLLDNVRIHLDEVEGLGTFFELEAVLVRGKALHDCTEAVTRLRDRFAPALGEAISVSYADLVASGS
jgi:predicted adenylyl cyclase CyaB